MQVQCLDSATSGVRPQPGDWVGGAAGGGAPGPGQEAGHGRGHAGPRVERRGGRPGPAVGPPGEVVSREQQLMVNFTNQVRGIIF